MKIRTALVLLALATPAWADAPASPIGNWRTIDDKTGKERSMVHIEERNGLLYGTVISIIDPLDAAKTCDKCEDDRKDKPSLGLEVIRDMKPDGNHWDGGTVLDPETGSVYHGSIRLQSDGQHLVLRGYIGIPLFGRSQTWLRATP